MFQQRSHAVIVDVNRQIRSGTSSQSPTLLHQHKEIFLMLHLVLELRLDISTGYTVVETSALGRRS